MTQVNHVRTHLQAGKTITPASAMAVYGIFRLASVIEDLRNTGLAIDTVLKTDEMGKQYGEYRLRRSIEVNSTVQVKPGYGYGIPAWVKKTRGSRVIATNDDASLVRFIRGSKLTDEWMNYAELINCGA